MGSLHYLLPRFVNLTKSEQISHINCQHLKRRSSLSKFSNYHQQTAVIPRKLAHYSLVFANWNARRKTPLEFHFMYISNKTCHWSFKTCDIISVLLDTKCHLLHNLIFFCSNNIFFISHVLKFKFPSRQDKIEANIQKSIKNPF